MFDYDFDFGGDYESLADEIALEGRQEWDHEARAACEEWAEAHYGDNDYSGEEGWSYDPDDYA